jgi:hypothetical protein
MKPALILSLTLLCGGSAAQTAPQKPPSPPKAEAPPPLEKPPEKEEEALTPLKLRALDLLAEVGSESASLTDHRLAALLQARAADVLYAHDRERSRAFFESAFEAALRHYRETKDDNRRRVGSQAWTQRSDARIEVLRLVSRHDPELGRLFGDRYVEEKRREVEERASRPERESINPLLGEQAAVAAGLIEAAQKLIEADPLLAISVARRALAIGVPAEAAGFLARLAGRDQKSSDALYLFALETLSRREDPFASAILVLSAYPFNEGSIRLTDGGGSSYGYGFGKVKEFKIRPEIITPFLLTSQRVLARVASSDPSRPGAEGRFGTALFAARLLEPRVAEHLPARLDEWKRMMVGLQSLLSEAKRAGVERDLASEVRQQHAGEAAPEASPGERLKTMIERAEGAKTPNERDRLFQQAADLAARAGDLAQALKLIDRIVDLSHRRQARSWVLFGASDRARREGRLDEARRLALEVEATDERAYLLMEIARASLKGKDRATAVEIIEEAYRQAVASENSPAKVRSLFGLAHLTLELDQQRAFEIAGEAVRTVNQVGLDSFSPGDEQGQLVRVFEAGGNTMVNSTGVEGFDLGQSLAAIARRDFEGAVSLARSIDHRAWRLAAQIEVAASAFKQK